MNLIPSSLLLLNRVHKQLWLWPSSSFCTHNHPKTLSFRAATTTTHDHHQLQLFSKDQDYPELVVEELATLGSCCFTNHSSEFASINNSTVESKDDDCSTVETIVRGARSERLFFEPGPTSSILIHETTQISQEGGSSSSSSSTSHECESTTNENDINGGLACKEMINSSVAMVVMESENPYIDFKKSMAEIMVEIHDHDQVTKDWDRLEELLGWYLRMNAKNNHHFIVEAFVDLLFARFSGDHSQANNSFTTTSAASSTTLSSPISSHTN